MDREDPQVRDGTVVGTCATSVVHLGRVLVVGVHLKCRRVVRLNCERIILCRCTIVRYIEGIGHRKHAVDAAAICTAVPYDWFEAESFEETVCSQHGPYLFGVGFDITVQG